MNYDLPQSVTIQGVNYDFRADFRPILDICTALSDPELNAQERAEVALCIFYPSYDAGEMNVLHYQDAVDYCMWFINGGEDVEGERNTPRLVDWEQDFNLIVAPINHILGGDVRSLPFLHWWTWLSAYREIGNDCTFAQVVSIRDKQARHKSLDKSDREWLRRNRRLVEFKRKYTEPDESLLREWI